MHIDWWTLALQTVNVIILIWILARFFFQPVADIVARRQEETDKLMADATAARRDALAAREGANQARAAIGTERDRLIAEAGKAARAEQEKLRDQATQEIAKLHHEAELAIERDRAAAEQAVIDRAAALAVEIAERVLGRFPPKETLTLFLDGLGAALRALSPEAKASFASATVDHPIEVVTAAPLSNDEAAHVRRMLKETLGADIPITCRTDPALIAGLELHSASTIVRNSWRADLDRIREELDRGKQLHGA